MKIYLVGGAVRDRLLGKNPSDLDFLVMDGDEATLRRSIGGLVRVGKGIPVFVRGNEQYTLSTYSTIHDDLASRDLTINAVAMDDQGELFAHPQALADLNAKILRPVHSDNFHADPLRAFRAARFAAAWPEYGVHPDLVDAMKALLVPQLAALAGERVGAEVMKACAAPKPSRFFVLLAQGACLEPWLSCFTQCSGDELYRLGCDLDRASGDALAVWMIAGFHMGRTTEISGSSTSLLVRPDMKELARKLRLPNIWGVAGVYGQRRLDQALLYPTLKKAEKVRLLLDVHKAGIMTSFWAAATALGADYKEVAAQELGMIRNVHLPAESRNLGRQSAEILLQLQIEALS